MGAASPPSGSRKGASKIQDAPPKGGCRLSLHMGKIFFKSFIFMVSCFLFFEFPPQSPGREAPGERREGVGRRSRRGKRGRIDLLSRAEISVLVCKIRRQHVHDQPDQHILVLGVRLRNKQGQSRQSDIVDDRASILPHQTAIPVRKVEKEHGGTAFVASENG